MIINDMKLILFLSKNKIRGMKKRRECRNAHGEGDKGYRLSEPHLLNPGISSMGNRLHEMS